MYPADGIKVQSLKWRVQPETPCTKLKRSPLINTAIYVKWNETSSDEPAGWYYAVIKEYLKNRQAKIEYADHDFERLLQSSMSGLNASKNISGDKVS